ncbi:Lacal_2735 family protein [Winogradskyella litorisediminis]|uniref:Lacal_2735 family protein n=1 Tax=Winogradskyella litorisediminis TaxID=1156618 RepID=A0ABW3N9K2_9FLAO
MFGLFKKTSELEKLQKKYEKLMADWHRLSTTNRAESDKKYAEAEEISKRIEAIKSKS